MKHFSVVVLFVLLSSLVQGSDLSGFVAWNHSGDLTTAASSIEVDNYSTLGVRYEKTFLGIFGFENTLAYTRGIMVPADASEEDDGLYYSGAFVLNIPVGRLVPNFAWGLGFLHRFGDSFPDTGTSFLTNWGIGVKFRELAGPLGLRFDYRRLKLYDVLDEDFNTQALSGGVILRF